MTGPNRMPPQLGAEHMKTYESRAPQSTHFRPGTCAEVDCPAHLNGWRTTLDERTEQGMSLAYYIRKESKRKYTEDRTETGLTVFTFPPGQKCFREHQTRLDRPEIYLVRGGDWRGNPRGTETRRHTSAADWQEDFADHQQTLADRLEEG